MQYFSENQIKASPFLLPISIKADYTKIKKEETQLSKQCTSLLRFMFVGRIFFPRPYFARVKKCGMKGVAVS